MKLHNYCGLLFGNFLTVFFGAWRYTLPKIFYILSPNDPRQLQKELPQYILGHYRSAFLFCWATRGKKEDDIPTPAEVHKYMLNRAENSPLRQAVLLQLRYAENGKILNMSARKGERGSVNHFMSAIL
jgi:hypothetical protein